MRIIVYGANGKNGRNLVQLCREGYAGSALAAAVSRSFAQSEEPWEYATLPDFEGSADCVIDFSNHEAIGDILAYCAARKIPVVVATTGHTDFEKTLIRQASKVIPIFLSYNMSLGIAVMGDLVKRAAAAFPEADIEIVEIHHNQKVDVPSGTALMLANKIKEVRPAADFVVGRNQNGQRNPKEVGIHSLRIGSETGTHEVIISNGTETITIRHEAENRILFDKGALTAAAFLIRQPAGLYTMKDMLEVKIAE